MRIKCGSVYNDGHESTIEYTVDDSILPLRGDLSFADWMELVWDVLHPYAGDGHGANSALGWYYDITILEAADPTLVGQFWENCGN